MTEEPSVKDLDRVFDLLELPRVLTADEQAEMFRLLDETRASIEAVMLRGQHEDAR